MTTLLLDIYGDLYDPSSKYQADPLLPPQTYELGLQLYDVAGLKPPATHRLTSLTNSLVLIKQMNISITLDFYQL